MGKSSDDNSDDAAKIAGEFSRDVARDKTYADRANQYNPLGSLEWEQSLGIDPATGEQTTKWTQNMNLDPRLQCMLDKDLGMMGGRQNLAEGLNARIGAEMGQGPDWDQFGQAQSLAYSPLEIDQATRYGGGVDELASGLDFDPNQIRQTAEENAYQKDKMRLDPRFQQRSEQLDIKLRNQGLRPGDQAYDAQFSTLGNERTDAYERARLGAGDVGRAESGQLFGQAQGMFGANLSAANAKTQDMDNRNRRLFSQQGTATDHANALRDKDIGEYLGRRSFSLNEADKLRQGSSYQDISELVKGE